MAIALNYPTPMTLYEIEQDRLPGLIAERNSPFLDAFPMRPIEDTVIRWEKYDNFTGLMNFRGYDNKPGRVKDIGYQSFQTQPGVYGEFMEISEELLTRRGMIGHLSQKMDISDQVGLLQRKLLGRRLDRIEWIISQFVINGTYSVPDLTGVSVTGDSWTPPSFAASTAWSNYTTSTPLADMQAIALIPFGQSVDTGPNAELVMNRKKFNQLTLNRNSNDFWGYRNAYGATVGNSLEAINSILMAQGLPKIRIYEGLYAADNGTATGSYTRYMLDNTAVLFAKRTSGAKTGAFAITWNAQSQAAAPYTFVKDRKEEVPRTVEVHDGFNGGPLIEYPGTIVVATGL